MGDFIGGFFAGAPFWTPIGFILAAILMAAKQSDKQLLSPQEIDDLIESTRPQFDEKA